MKRLLAASFAFLLLLSCKKEYSEVFINDPGNPANDTAWKSTVANNAPVNQILNALKNKSALIDSFDAATGGIINFGDSIIIDLPANAYKNSTGENTSGKVQLELLLLRKKGDFIRYQRPTASGNYLLETGGAVYIKVTKNGEPVDLVNGEMVNISYKESSPNNNMQLFYGDTTVNNTGNFDWQPADSGRGYVNTKYDSTHFFKGYELLSNRFSWINCDRFIDTTVDKTICSALLPLNFTNNNTALFIVFKEQRIVARMFADPEHRLFSLQNIPIGSKITMISLSTIGNDYYLASKDVIVRQSMYANLMPEKKTLNDINVYIDGL